MPRATKSAPARQSRPAPAGPTAWAGLVSRVLDFAEASGLPRRVLLDVSGLERVRLTGPEARVPLLCCLNPARSSRTWRPARG